MFHKKCRITKHFTNDAFWFLCFLVIHELYTDDEKRKIGWLSRTCKLSLYRMYIAFNQKFSIYIVHLCLQFVGKSIAKEIEVFHKWLQNYLGTYNLTSDITWTFKFNFPSVARQMDMFKKYWPKPLRIFNRRIKMFAGIPSESVIFTTYK